MAESGIVNIHGRDYKTVALRVHEFREGHTIEDGWAILTRVVAMDESHVVVEAKIVNPQGVVVAQDYAEEKRGSSMINRTSALENGCTSAIGRALSACGFAGSEYASADELVNALAQQAASPAPQRANSYTAAAPTNGAEPCCPQCGGPMWDNRDRKGPDWKCKAGKWNKETKTTDGCDGTIWNHADLLSPAENVNQVLDQAEQQNLDGMPF